MPSSIKQKKSQNFYDITHQSSVLSQYSGNSSPFRMNQKTVRPMSAHQPNRGILLWKNRKYNYLRDISLLFSLGGRKSVFLKIASTDKQKFFFFFAATVLFLLSKFSRTEAGSFLEIDETLHSINPADASLALQSPVSMTRPRYQFTSRDVMNQAPENLGDFKADMFSIFTFSKQPSEKLFDCAYTILSQSLKDFQWIVFHSCGIMESCFEILQRVERMDRRIILIQTSSSMDFEGRYKSAIAILKAKPTQFFTFLQEGDTFELTALEKSAWVFYSNPNVIYVTTYVKELNTDDVIWKNGFHTNLNPFSIGEEESSFWIMGRTDALLKNRCILFSRDTGSEDGNIRKCLQDYSYCGATIPEALRWSERNTSEFMLETNQNSKAREPGFFNSLQAYNHTEKANQMCSFRGVEALDMRTEIRLRAPFENELHTKNGILFILPWMSVGGADIANLNLLQEFSKRGYRVTIVCTLMQVHQSSRALESLFLRFSHDLFTIPNIIRVTDAPRFLSYLIRSRNVELVLLSNAELGYSLLSYLTQEHKSVKFVDYLHNEQPKWRGGGYPLMSSKGKAHLDMSFASSKSAIEFMMKHGKNRNRARLGHLGIRLDHLKPFDGEKKSYIRQRLGIPTKAILVSFIGRTVYVKQPMVVLNAFLRVARTLQADKGGDICIHLLIAGDGEGRNELELEAARHPDSITLKPLVDHKEALELIGISDVFCLPSLAEGISFATAEAMALGVATITSDIGGFPELIGKHDEGGLMFSPTGDEEGDVLKMMVCLEKLIRNDGWRKGLQKRAERRVRRIFDASVAIPNLVTKILQTRVVRDIGGNMGRATMRKILRRQLIHYKNANGPITGFAQIQRALAIRKRVGYGAKYQKICGEYEQPWPKIIDALEQGSSCEGYILDLEALRTSALSQCGKKRIENLRDRNRTMGWELSGKCHGFVPVVL